MNGERKISVEVVGNAYKLQLRVVDEAGVSLAHGKPVVILDTADDAILGKGIRDLLRTRVRTARKKDSASEAA